MLVFSVERRVTHARSLLADTEGVCARLQPSVSSYILLCQKYILAFYQLFINLLLFYYNAKTKLAAFLSVWKSQLVVHAHCCKRRSKKMKNEFI